ncbi:MAG: DUF6502 family protein [Myxococcota bacterium]
MQDRPALAAAVRSVLRPLVRILLRNQVDVWTLVETVKQIYVDVASREFAAAERKPTVSRVSLLTGLTRKEVSRLWEQDENAGVDSARYSRAANVITGWIRSPGYQAANGDPLELAFDGARRSFSDLARRFGTDVTPRALLDELLSAGAVERTPANRLRLLARGYVPRTDDAEKLGILGADVADLISSVDHNIVNPPERAFFQRKVAYDNLVAACLPELRERAARRGQTLLEALDGFMAAHDRDANPSVTGEGRHRAVLGIYYYEEPVAKPVSEGDEHA